jgi:hypothetical protein
MTNTYPSSEVMMQARIVRVDGLKLGTHYQIMTQYQTNVGVEHILWQKSRRAIYTLIFRIQKLGHVSFP